jgi:hypothetical protein
VAITEQPSAAMRDVLITAGDGEGTPAAFQRVIAASLMKEDFGKAAVKPRRIGAAAIVRARSTQAIIEPAVVENTGEGRTIDR